jgi:hypothetical protein
MRKAMATVAILVLIGTLSLWQQSAAEGPAAPERDDVEARVLLKAANEGLTALNREIDIGNVALTPDLMGRWGQWIRRVYDASVLVDRSPASRLKAAEEYLHHAEDMGKRLAMIKSEENLIVILGMESKYHVAAAKFEIARIKAEGTGR